MELDHIFTSIEKRIKIMNSHSYSYKTNSNTHKEFELKKTNVFNGMPYQELEGIIYNHVGTPELINKFLRMGTWNATYITYKKQFKLILNSKYLFHFTNGFKCFADNGIKTITGEWHTGYDNNLLKLKLSFNIPQELVSFNKIWYVMHTAEHTVRLLLPGENNNKFEFLTLEKP